MSINSNSLSSVSSIYSNIKYNRNSNENEKDNGNNDTIDKESLKNDDISQIELPSLQHFHKSHQHTINTKERYIILKQFQGPEFSLYFPSELEPFIDKDSFYSILNMSNKYNRNSVLFIIIHSINVSIIISLQVIIFFLLFYFNADYILFLTIIIPTILLFLSSFLINYLQKILIKRKIEYIEKKYKDLQLKYKNLLFIPFIQKVEKSLFFFSVSSLDIKEIIVEYPSLHIEFLKDYINNDKLSNILINGGVNKNFGDEDRKDEFSIEIVGGLVVVDSKNKSLENQETSVD